ncbi:conserved Plasmodium protein, unknown function [Plasmodium gallinaceum]|uniref:Uncharacterized protein n=1 Tax=Plasmodium gallinaceum TaxID=5849 RepID=A0A1J1GX80_PLAGA|nr:conserved Plasmodium protein, unknown function [Plasmodium gallinaceum]CRG97052.1 conserved Plasmodium protein, unknown function [Plasmodium gallinaceum]
MSKPKILISQIKNITDIKTYNLKGIESSKKKIFGYVENLPGEKNWLKPLIGKSMQNYYFPSKYLHLDFNLKEYLRMQTVRFKKKDIDDSLIKLQKCINLIIENKVLIDNFLSKISKELFLENQSLKDFYALYLTIFPYDKYSHNLSFNISELNIPNERFNWFNFNNENINKFKNKQNLDHSNISTDENLKENKLHNLANTKDKNKLINDENYKRIIFTKTKNDIQFKKIICREKKENEKEKEDKIYYLNCNVNLGLEEPIENKKEIEEKEQSKHLFYKLINENENIKKTLLIRNRFIDPLYLRRRYSYIDKLTKKKIKKEKYKTYRKHFIQHADEKKIWPDNKGLLNKIYPNPYS